MQKQTKYINDVFLPKQGATEAEALPSFWTQTRGEGRALTRGLVD